jgi:hypothetical protein
MFLCLLLMPPRAHSISAGRPTAPDTAPLPVLHGLLESAKGIAVRCFCLGDFSLHDSGLRSGWYVFAVEDGNPRQLKAAEDEIVNEFRFKH